MVPVGDRCPVVGVNPVDYQWCTKGARAQGSAVSNVESISSESFLRCCKSTSLEDAHVPKVLAHLF